MREQKFNLFDHYKKLWFYNWHRHENDNMSKMREYFAQILIDEIEEFMPLDGKTMLDVGGAYGEFCSMMHKVRNVSAINLDPVRADANQWQYCTMAYADHIPFPDNTFDLSISRGVFEHIPSDIRQESLNEVARVTKPDGLIYILIPPWLNPHAGHSFKPFHYLPFPVAKYLRRVLKGRETPPNVKSYQDASLYPLTYHGMMKLIHNANCEVVGTKDTHFRLHFMTQIPVLNELLVPAVAFILKKTS